MAEIDDIKSIKSHISNEELKNVYLFYGPESYLKDLYTQRIKQRLACEEMNCYFYGPDVQTEEISNICSSVSMFGDQKLIVISGSNFFKSATDSTFMDLAEGSGTYIVFKEEDIDKRSKLYKKVCETGIVFNCKKQPPAEIKKMLLYTVKSSGREIEDNVLQYLLDGIANDISKLMSEVEKLILYVPVGEAIRKEHVDQLCTLTYSAKIFDLNDAVALGDRDRAFRILKSLIDDKEPPVKILAILSKMWSQLYSVKLLTQSGANAAQTAAYLGIKDFAAMKLIKQAARMELPFIREKINLCEELDMLIKSGGIKDLTAVELLTVQ